jgi:hypothetical protein
VVDKRTRFVFKEYMQTRERGPRAVATPARPKKKRSREGRHAADLLAFKALVDQGKGPLEIREILDLTIPTFYRLKQEIEAMK